MKVEELISRAKLSIKVKDYDQAIKFLNKVLKLEPDITGINILLGVIHQKQKKYNKAIEYYNIALKKNNDDIDALNNLGIIYKELEEYDKSLGYLENALRLEPKRPDILYNVGNVYKSLGKNEEAIKFFQKALQINPNFRFAYNNLGTVYEELGEIDRAINIFQKGLKIDPNNPRLHYNLGIAYEYKNNLDISLNEFKKALKINPNLIEAHNNLGVIYEKINRLEEAVKSYSNALDINPNYTKALNNLALVYEKLGENEKAVSNYKKAINIEPKYSVAKINLGRAYLNSNDLKNAKKMFEDIIRESYDNLDAYNDLAKTEIKLKNYKKAIEIYKYILGSKNDPVIRNELKNLYLDLNMNNEAKEELIKIKQLSAGNIESLINVARSYYKIKEYKEAFKIIDEILKKSPDNKDALLLSSDIMISIKNYDRALKILNKLEKTDVNSNILNHNYALCYQGLGKVSKALTLMERIIDASDMQKSTDKVNDFDLLNNLIIGHENEMQKLEQQNENEKKRIREILHDIDFKSILEGTKASIDSIEKNEKIGKLDIDEDLKQLQDDDMPILNIGDTEPDYLIEEEEENISLNELEEEKGKEDEFVEPETNSLINLLNDEDTYSDKLFDGSAKNVDMSKRLYQNLSNNYSVVPLNTNKEMPPNIPVNTNQNQIQTAQAQTLPVQTQVIDNSQLMNQLAGKFNEIDDKLENFNKNIVEKKLDDKLKEMDEKLSKFKENFKNEFEENGKYNNIENINNENPLKSYEAVESDINLEDVENAEDAEDAEEVEDVEDDTDTLDSSVFDDEVSVEEEDENISDDLEEALNDNKNLEDEEEDFMNDEINPLNEIDKTEEHKPEEGPYEKLRTIEHSGIDEFNDNREINLDNDTEKEETEIDELSDLEAIPPDDELNGEIDIKEENEDFNRIDADDNEINSCREPELFNTVDSSNYSEILDYFPPVDPDNFDEFEAKSSDFEQQIKNSADTVDMNIITNQSSDNIQQDINLIFKVRTKKIRGREIDIFY